VRDQVSHPYKTTGKIAVLYILMFISTTVLLQVRIKCCTLHDISTAVQTNYPPSCNPEVHYSTHNSAPLVPSSARSVYPPQPHTLLPSYPNYVPSRCPL
jgi:hypothetical protein